MPWINKWELLRLRSRATRYEHAEKWTEKIRQRSHGFRELLEQENAKLRRELRAAKHELRCLKSSLAETEGKSPSRPRSRSGARRLSAQGREAISRAAKKRWAAYRRDKASR